MSETMWITHDIPTILFVCNPKTGKFVCWQEMFENMGIEVEC